MNQRLNITNLIGHIEETMPYGLLKISKFLLRSTPAGHNQRELAGLYKKKIKHAKLGNAMLDN